MYFLNIYKPSIHSDVVKTDLQNICSSSTGLLNLYRFSTGSTVVKTVMIIVYILSSSLAVDKTDPDKI